MDTNMLGFLRDIGLSELIVILAIILLLFGSTKLPALARSMGKSISEFKKGMKEGTEETKDKPSETPKVSTESREGKETTSEKK